MQFLTFLWCQRCAVHALVKNLDTESDQRFFVHIKHQYLWTLMASLTASVSSILSLYSCRWAMCHALRRTLKSIMRLDTCFRIDCAAWLFAPGNQREANDVSYCWKKTSNKWFYLSLWPSSLHNFPTDHFDTTETQNFCPILRRKHIQRII